MFKNYFENDICIYYILSKIVLPDKFLFEIEKSEHFPVPIQTANEENGCKFLYKNRIILLSYFTSLEMGGLR